jgi:transposase
VHRYSLEFKRQAVKLSQLEGVEIQAVADALDIHPFMLSRWRKEMRDCNLRGPDGVAPVKRLKVRELKPLAVMPTQ